MADQKNAGNCPRCDMPVATGSNPTTKDGRTYCCEGCAAGGECSCPAHKR